MATTFTLAIDFDGTIVEAAYPEIGAPIKDAFSTLIRLQNEGHRLILWTYRSGETLKAAVDFCLKNGIEFYAVNKNFPEEQMEEDISRKILADYYIDDRSIEGLPDWNTIYELIQKYREERSNNSKKKGFFKWR